MSIPASDPGDPAKVFGALPADLAVAGGLWVAPFGSQLPDDVDTDLSVLKGPDGTTADVYVNLGYLSPAGASLKIDGRTRPLQAWSGAEIGGVRDGFTVSLSTKLLQVLDAHVNATIFGPDAVSTAPATRTTGERLRLAIGSKLPDRATMVLDSFFEAKSMRHVLEIVQVDELGALKPLGDDVVAYEPTFTVFRGRTGKHVIRYSDDGVVNPNATAS